MIEPFLFIIAGLALLGGGGELLVRSAARVATTVGVSPLVVGLTIVAYGTSAPELGVSLFAALQGSPEIALANVVGSNIFNVGFILGLCAMLSPLTVNLRLIRADVPVMIAVSLLAWVLCFDEYLGRVDGVILFVGAMLYTVWLIRASRREPVDVEREFNDALKPPGGSRLLPQVLWIFLSVGILVGGSRLLVSGATDLARQLNVSESLIGLTIVAAGTSLPEVATSVMATLRGQTDIAIGNVIGSNIFNILLILGLSAGLNPGLGVARSLLLFDLPFMAGMAVVCFPLLVTARKLVRWEGALLLAGYAVYTGFLIHRG